MTRKNSPHGSQILPVVLCMQNNVISIRNTSLYGSQPSSVVLLIQNGDFSITKTSLYGSQPSFVAIVFKTAALGPELQVSMGTRLRLLICECKTACLDLE